MKNKINSVIRKAILTTSVMILLVGKSKAQDQILKDVSGTPTPSNIIFENDNYVGIGTKTPNGPLEVRDNASPVPGAPDVANVVVTEVNNSFVLCQQNSTCIGCPPPPPTPPCRPLNAMIVRSENYNLSGSFTGYKDLFTLNRAGHIGIGMAPLSSVLGGISGNSGISLANLSMDLVRSGSYSSTFAVPPGIIFRDEKSVANHSIRTDKDNVLTIFPGINKTAPDILHVAGRLWVGNQQPINNYGDYMLSVDGKILAKRCIVQTSDWADFVFNADYNLMPLPELANYLQENKHLPNIPTEAAVVKGGVDVGEMNKALLQKVEELTLYMIQQNKRIDELQTIINKKTR